MIDTQWMIQGGTSLLQHGNGTAAWEGATVAIDGAHIGHIGVAARTDATRRVFDASGLLVLPGMVDIHGDAFERQVQPRPHTVFAHDIALADTDRQLAANGITTACHGLTYSWEGGLRGRQAALALMDQIALQTRTAQVQHLVHLRFENHHLDGVADVLDWIAQGRIAFLAFNDHLPGIAAKLRRADKLAAYAERARCSADEFMVRLDAARQHGDAVPEAIARIAAACRAHGIAMASHDDETSGDRERYEALGARVCEFPRSQDALAKAITLGNHVVMGAPNVLLGGSHCGGLSTADAVRDGRCHILASDYYYPSLLQAPFALAHGGACSLADAWKLVSANPAAALGLADRGGIAHGSRADLVLVEPAPGGRVRLVATISAGKLAYCADPDRIGLLRPYAQAA